MTSTTKQLVFVDVTNTVTLDTDESKRPDSIQGTFERFHAEGIEMETDGCIRVSNSGAGDMVLDVYGHVLADKIRARSDERLKTNIRAIESSLDVIKQLSGKVYQLKNETKSSYGLIAQEVLPVIPEIVHTDSDTGMMNISYLELIPVLIEAIKELDIKLDKIFNTLA
jgi:hypothetical protein